MSLDGTLRFIHIAAAMAWFGGSLLLVTRVIPAITAAGDAGRPVLERMVARGGTGRYFAPAALITLITGGALYIRLDVFEWTGMQRGLLELGIMTAIVALGLGIVSDRLEKRMAQGVDDWDDAVRRSRRLHHIILGLTTISVIGMAGRGMFA